MDRKLAVIALTAIALSGLAPAQSMMAITNGISTLTPVAIVSHSMYQSCTSPSLTCGVPLTISHTGDTMLVFLHICQAINCLTAGVPTASMSDGTNTYTQIGSNCVQSPTTIITGCAFVAANVTAGSYTLTITMVAGSPGTNTYFQIVQLVELSGGNHTTPLDSNVTQTGSGTSAAPSITSPGNVTYPGEVGIGYQIVTSNPLTQTGVFSALDNAGGNDIWSAKVVGPTVGSSLTLSASMTSGHYVFIMVGVRP